MDGAHNHKIQSIAFPKFPIKCAKFLQDGRRFVVGSNLHGHLFVYDMEAAKESRVHCETKERPSMKVCQHFIDVGNFSIFNSLFLSFNSTLGKFG